MVRVSAVEKTTIVRNWKPETISHMHACRVPPCLCYPPVSPILDKFEYLLELYLIFPPVFQFYCALSRSTFYSVGTSFYSYVTCLSLNS